MIQLCFQYYTAAGKKKFYSLIEKEPYFQLKNRLREVNFDKYNEIEQFLRTHRLTDHFSFYEFFEELNRIVRFKKIVIFIDEFEKKTSSSY